MKVIEPLGHHELLLLLAQLALLLLMARGLGEVAARFRLPSVVGELLAGFVLGPTLLGTLAPGAFEALFPPIEAQFHLLEVVSWLGVVMLLILTGLETDVGLILSKGRSAAAISLGGIIVPFSTGLWLGFVLPQEFIAAPDQRLVFALFIGTAMSISAIPVIAKVLMEMNVIRRDIGQVTLAAGMIDDTIGWILLSVVAGMATSGQVNLLSAGKSVLSVALVLGIAFTVGRRGVAAIIRAVDNRIGSDTSKITALMVLALGAGAITHLMGLEAVLGAFIVGILVGQVKRFDDRVRHAFEQVTLGVFAPIFFAASGLRVNLAELADPSVLGVGLLVLAIAIFGKFAGAYAGAKVGRLGHWEALSLGAGMNARGAMEIIVATIGLSLGILTPQMYSIILMVAIVTSLMAPPILRWTLKHVTIGEEEAARLAADERRRAGFVSNLKRVLLPTRGGVNSQIAAQLVAHVVNDEDVEVTSLYVDSGGNANGQADECLERIEHHLNILAPHNVRSLVRDDSDGVAHVVLEEARRGYDLLAIGATEQHSGARGQTLFNPLIDEIIQDAPCPLLIVSSRDEHSTDEEIASVPLRKILLPVSGTHYNQLAAEVAFSIARDRDIVVEVVHVVDRVRVSAGVHAEEGLFHSMDMAHELLGEIAAAGTAMGATVHTDVLMSADPEAAIVERARGRADLIVLASSRRRVTQRAFFGHLVDHVLRHATCPVAIVSSN